MLRSSTVSAQNIYDWRCECCANVHSSNALLYLPAQIPTH